MRQDFTGAWLSDESERYSASPMARLYPLVFNAMGPGNRLFGIYTTWDQAVASLTVALALLRELVEPGDQAKKAR